MLILDVAAERIATDQPRLVVLAAQVLGRRWLRPLLRPHSEVALEQDRVAR